MGAGPSPVIRCSAIWSSQARYCRSRRNGNSLAGISVLPAVDLAEREGGTLLSYQVEAQIGGKLAQLGQRLINGTTKNWQTSSSPTSRKPFQLR
jgi:carbon monoxide dehydrogenase subunit G